MEQLLIGLILGSVYALIALGYTLVYGVIKLINFAHGDIYMVGAFIGYYSLRFFIRWLNFTHGTSLIACFALSVVVSAVTCALLAIIMERLAYRPLRNSSRIAALITAVGVSFLLENLGIIVFGANPKSYEPKTLAVYQLQLAADESFADARTVELQEITQYTLPASRLSGPLFAHVRLVTSKGVSKWGPLLKIDPAQPGHLEERPDEICLTPGQMRPPASISYNVQVKGSGKVVTVGWATGDGSDISLQPIFSDSSGETLAIVLPVTTASGAQLRLPYFNIVIILTTLLVLGSLNLLINRTLFGISMRALSFDISTAKLMGVNTDMVIAWTFGIGGACAAIAGNMVGLYNQTIEPLMGILPGLKAFVAAVVGGIGSIPGAAIGGLIMGVSEALVKGLIPAQYAGLSDALAFAILIVVLLFKPSGIFGKTVKEKV